MPPDVHEESDQEVLAPEALMVDSPTLALLNKSEIDQQITTAKKFPRSMEKLLRTAMQLATQDAETADECIYALPRGGKVIEGPSARFAEIMAYSWGNCRCGARVIGEDDEFVTAMGSFFDMEQNCHIGYEVKRRITNSKGQRYNADMIGTTSNAASSIALRNAVLKGIPKAIWRKVYNEVRRAVAGDIKTLDARRVMMVKAFELQGARREQIFTLLGVAGIEDITADHLVTLRGVYNAIREGETTVDRAFAPRETQDTNLAEKSKSNLDKIKEKYAQQQQAEPAPAPADKPGASQPTPSSTPTQETTVPAAAADTSAAPRSQETPIVPTPSPAGPESIGAASGPELEPDEEWETSPSLPLQMEEDEAHGVPNIFDESPKGKSNRKK